MLGNILGNTPSERRPNAEFVQAVRERFPVVDDATEAAKYALHRQFPNLSTPVKPVEVPALATVTNEVASNVISLASQREFRVLNEQEQRVADARMAAEEARNEFAA